MSDKPKYRNATSVPLTLGMMAAMMTTPPKPILTPVQVAGQRALKIFNDLKWKISVSDRAVDTIRGLISEAIALTTKEIIEPKVRASAIAQFEKMMASLPSDTH